MLAGGGRFHAGRQSASAAIASVEVALEIVDVDEQKSIDQVVTINVFHRAFGPARAVCSWNAAACLLTGLADEQRKALVALLANSADTYVLFVLLWIAGPQGWSGAETALMVLALRLPALISGSLAGRAVDRWGAKPIMPIDLVGRGLLVTLMAISGRDGTLPLLPVLVLGGLAGGLSPATYAAVRSLIPVSSPGSSSAEPTRWWPSATRCHCCWARCWSDLLCPARPDREPARRGDHAPSGRRHDPPVAPM